LNLAPFETNDIKVVKIDKRELPNSWTVHLQLNAEGKKLEVIMNIRDGNIVGGTIDESLSDMTY
jgi:hypothetical protein